MKIIDKYILKEFMIPFMYCFFAFAVIYMVGDLFENLDNFIIQKVPMILVAKYYLFLIPSIFVLTTPLAVLLSVLYQLGYMSRHNELTALKASGVSFWRIAVPFGIVGIILSILLFVINERQVPRTTRELDEIRQMCEKKDTELDIHNYGNVTFFSSLYNLSFYADRILKNEAEKVSVREFYKDGTVKREWFGEKALYIDKIWWLFSGYVRGYDTQGAISGNTIFFKKIDVLVNIKPEDLINSQKDISIISNQMNSRELYSYIKRNFTKNTLPKELVVDLYRKMSIPFTILIVTAFAVTFGARISKGGAMASVGASLAFYLAYYGLNSFFITLGKLGKLIPSMAVWTPHILFAAISGYLLTKIR